MNKKLLGFAIAGIFLLATLVYAATLIEQVQVKTCTDSDGGLNFNVKGNVTGLDLNNTFYIRHDFCMTNNSLGEYACSSGGFVKYRELWSENCTCSNGRCI